jgi:ectoine hydroxylase-related dioxygenase (phytanoyl-CoA dioxygenase family)
VKKFDLDLHVAQFEEQGFTVFEEALESDFVDEVIATIERLEKELGIGPDAPVAGDEGSARALFERGSSRVRNCLRRDPIFQRVIVEPVMLDFLERVMGPGFLLSTSIISFTLNACTDQANPATTAQGIHADDYFIPLPRPYGPLACQSLWALTEFTEENGATRVIPGSHKYPHLPDYRPFSWTPEDGDPVPMETIPLLMPKGSIMVNHGSSWHGAGANMTDERRFCLSALFSQGWVRPTENMHLGLPFEMLESFEPRLQELLGLRGRYCNYVGHIDFDDPEAALFNA